MIVLWQISKLPLVSRAAVRDREHAPCLLRIPGKTCCPETTGSVVWAAGSSVASYHGVGGHPCPTSAGTPGAPSCPRPLLGEDRDLPKTPLAAASPEDEQLHATACGHSFGSVSSPSLSVRASQRRAGIPCSALRVLGEQPVEGSLRPGAAAVAPRGFSTAHRNAAGLGAGRR